MNDKQQAMVDAITAIMKSRTKQGPGGGGSMPPGEVDVPIDPNLLLPEDEASDDLPSDAKINDPDGVLDQLKQNQKNNNNNNNQGGSKESSGQQNGDESGNQEGSGGEPGQQKGKGNSKGTGSGTGSGDGEDQGAGQEKGTSDGEGKEDGNGQGEGESEGKGSGKGNGQEEGTGEDESGESQLSDSEFPDDFKDAWNEIMQRYDKDEISDKELQELIRKINLGIIDTL